MFNGFVDVALGTEHVSKNLVTLGDDDRFGILREEGYRVGCGFFGLINPVVSKGCRSK